MKSYAATSRLSFAFCFCNLLTGYNIRWDLFILRAQPLDMSPLGLCWHNNMLFPAKLPQCPVSQFEIPATFLGGSFAGIVEMVIYHLPCHQGASPWPAEDLTRCQWTAWLEEGFILLENWCQGLRCTMKPGEVQEPARGGEHLSSD
jgi:hypothetical protein